MARSGKRKADSGPLIAEILALLGQATAKLEPESDETLRWLLKHSRTPAIAAILQEATLLMLRVVDAIGRLEPVNGITISKQYGIPKGSVSKVTRRLIAKKLIATESLPDNKKEVLFRLTPLGRELFEVHRAFDAQMERGFVRFLERYEAEELQSLARVLQDSLEVSFLDLGAEARKSGDRS